MKKIYIIHRWEGSSESDWIPWSKEELEKLGYSVFAFDMPNTDEPVIGEWVEYLKNTVDQLDNDTYFIGHSIGCQAIMRYLETVDQKIGGAIFVAGWFNLVNLENEESEAIAEPWIKIPLNFEKIKTNIPVSVVVLGDNDPWVPYEETKSDFENKLGSEIVTLLGAGHITEDDGFGPFPKLVEIFKENFK